MEFNFDLRDSFAKKITENNHYMIGIDYLIQCDKENGLKSFTKAYEAFSSDEELRNSKAFCQFLLRYSALVLNEKKEIDDDKRIALLNEAMIILKGINLTESLLYSDCLYHLANSYYWKMVNTDNETIRDTNRKESNKFLEQSRVLYEKLENESGVLKCKELEETHRFREKKYKESIELSQQILKILFKNFDFLEKRNKISQLFEISFHYRNLAESYGYIECKTEMRESLKKALAIYKNLRNFLDENTSHCHMKLSMCTQNEESLENAIEAVRLQEQLNADKPDESEMLIARYVYQGDAYMKNSENSKAKKSYEKALEIINQQTDEYKEKNSKYIETIKSKIGRCNQENNHTSRNAESDSWRNPKNK